MTKLNIERSLEAVRPREKCNEVVARCAHREIMPAVAPAMTT